MTVELNKLKSSLGAITGKLQAYEHAMGVMYYDAATGAPRGGAEDRGKTLAVLSEVVYGLRTGDETGELLRALDERRDELDLITGREVTVLLRDYERTKKIPMEEYVAYQVLLNEADAVWHRAKTENDWPAFEPYMEKIVAFNRKLAGWLDPEKMRQFSLNPSDISAAVREQNAIVPAGQVGAAPAPPGQAIAVTVNAASRALLRGGASAVDVLTFARVVTDA